MQVEMLVSLQTASWRKNRPCSEREGVEFAKLDSQALLLEPCYAPARF